VSEGKWREYSYNLGFNEIENIEASKSNKRKATIKDKKDEAIAEELVKSALTKENVFVKETIDKLIEENIIPEEITEKIVIKDEITSKKEITPSPKEEACRLIEDLSNDDINTILPILRRLVSK
jgi:hypothetical protein